MKFEPYTEVLIDDDDDDDKAVKESDKDDGYLRGNSPSFLHPYLDQYY